MEKLEIHFKMTQKKQPKESKKNDSKVHTAFPVRSRILGSHANLSHWGGFLSLAHGIWRSFRSRKTTEVVGRAKGRWKAMNSDEMLKFPRTTENDLTQKVSRWFYPWQALSKTITDLFSYFFHTLGSFVAWLLGLVELSLLKIFCFSELFQLILGV